MRHSDDWFKSEKDYSWIPGAMMFGALLIFGFVAYICLK